MPYILTLIAQYGPANNALKPMAALYNIGRSNA
ncbi:MAG: hypothetical protein JWP38_5 [Herbaspirillum sp.]|nr:hypothetical protein [Herbaspirillum sp.]